MINLLFTISTAEGGFVLLLEDLVIHREHRGHGYGSKLLDHAIEFAKQVEKVNLFFLEDALSPEDIAYFRLIRQQCATPLAMGELSLLPAVRKADAGTLIVADGTSCRHQIQDGAGRQAIVSNMPGETEAPPVT